MGTSEAQVFARALYESLVSSALDALRAAMARLNGAGATPTEQQVLAALPASTPAEVKNLVQLLAREGKLSQLAPIAGAFERLAQGQQTVLTGEVTSAVPLDDAQRQRIVSDLRTKYGSTLELSFSVDPSLIGGLIIRVGDQVLDNSLRTRLSSIQRNMLAS